MKTNTTTFVESNEQSREKNETKRTASLAARRQRKKGGMGRGGGGGADWKKEKKKKEKKFNKKEKNLTPTRQTEESTFFSFLSLSLSLSLSGVSDSVTADINFDVGTCSRQRLDGGYGWIINISTPKPSSQMIFAHLVCRSTGLRVFKYIVSLGPFLGAGLWEVCARGEYASSTHWPRPSSGRYLGIWVWS